MPARKPSPRRKALTPRIVELSTRYTPKQLTHTNAPILRHITAANEARERAIRALEEEYGTREIRDEKAHAEYQRRRAEGRVPFIQRLQEIEMDILAWAPKKAVLRALITLQIPNAKKRARVRSILYRLEEFELGFRTITNAAARKPLEEKWRNEMRKLEKELGERRAESIVQQVRRHRNEILDHFMAESDKISRSFMSKR